MARIAIIDSDEDLVDLVSQLFDERGWEALPSRDANTALADIQQASPDVVILDLWLDTPTTGWDLLRYLKQEPATQAIPVIVCSAARDQLARGDDWLRANRITVLHKPFDIDALYGVVSEALTGSPMESG